LHTRNPLFFGFPKTNPIRCGSVGIGVGVGVGVGVGINTNEPISAIWL
jgi:pantoate kinase